MSALEIIFGIALILFAVAIVFIVLLQEGEQRNSSVITGGSSDTFLSKHQGRSITSFLAKVTAFVAIGFFALVIIVNIILFIIQPRVEKPAEVLDGAALTEIVDENGENGVIVDENGNTIVAIGEEQAENETVSETTAEATSEALVIEENAENEQVSEILEASAVSTAENTENTETAVENAA